MKKLVLAMTAAGLCSAFAPAQAGELDDMKAAMQKMQERIAQLEAQAKAAPRAAPDSKAPVLSNSSLGANANVTVYGKIDLFTEYNSGGGKGDRLSLESGGLNGTRLGVKGGADITDGVRGVFQLESGIFLNKGTLAQGGRLLGRQAFAGIEGKYGRLTAGRQYSPLYNAVINYDAYEQGYGSPTTDGNVSTGSTRFDNALVYASPKFKGLSANVMLALGGETGKSSDAMALAVNYENGPFDMSVAYQDDDHASRLSPATPAWRHQRPRLRPGGPSGSVANCPAPASRSRRAPGRHPLPGHRRAPLTLAASDRSCTTCPRADRAGTSSRTAPADPRWTHRLRRPRTPSTAGSASCCQD